MKIHRSNLIDMLKLAIEVREKQEKEIGQNFQSALVRGTKEFVKHLEKGGNIEFYES